MSRKGAKDGRGSKVEEKPKVTRADLEAKLTEIDAELSETGEAVKPTATAIGIGAVVVILILAFYFGRRKGERRSTVVEVRRL